MWLRDVMTPASRIKYMAWRASRLRVPVTVKLSGGQRLTLRPAPSTDLGTAREIFVENAYTRPDQVPEFEPEFIVDLGANVGYSVVFWTHLFPKARLVAYEPHPRHLGILHKHVALNGVAQRVSVMSAASSNVEFNAYLTDNENESKLTAERSDSCIDVTVRDLMSDLKDKRVDLLKMDIEGGEYLILQDPRFVELNIPYIAMEWHNTTEIKDGRRWCVDRLRALGYSIADGALRYENAGMLWAWK
jgi:FkbM family methyltransferase